MDRLRFDQITKLFAERRLSRRQALHQGGASLAAAGLAAAGLNTASAQDATPEMETAPVPGSDQKVAYLFLQSFQAGSIAPKAGEEGVFTLTLEQGLGQTVYFSDRPLRDVGATPTPQFLEAIGFPADNPPNAALVAENGDNVNIAVVQLLNPTYDLPTRTATYDVVGMAHFQREAGMEVVEATADISAVPATFEAAHLFIDDCPDTVIGCFADGGHGARVHHYGMHGYCYNYLYCVPCEPYYHANPYDGAAFDWWSNKCNQEVPECNGNCRAKGA